VAWLALITSLTCGVRQVADLLAAAVASVAWLALIASLTRGVREVADLLAAALFGWRGWRLSPR